MNDSARDRAREGPRGARTDTVKTREGVGAKGSGPGSGLGGRSIVMSLSACFPTQRTCFSSRGAHRESERPMVYRQRRESLKGSRHPDDMMTFDPQATWTYCAPLCDSGYDEPASPRTKSGRRRHAPLDRSREGHD